MPPPQMLQSNQQQIAALQLGNQAIRYEVANWNKYFSQDPEFQSIATAYPYKISRNDLYGMAATLDKCYKWNSLRKLFFSIMVWGFGRTGYGAFRTNKMVTDNNFQKVVEDTYCKIKSGKILNAYNDFKLNKCGSAFFTKFFYFAVPRSRDKPLPLILDAVVSRRLENDCNLNISRYAKVARDKVKQISAVYSYADGYINYIQDMDNWAKSLKVQSDQIELFLFS
ncbi:hypothetical protein KAU39_01620 [bacterium]|nr:hypothetical protein [bacterium]